MATSEPRAGLASELLASELLATERPATERPASQDAWPQNDRPQNDRPQNDCGWEKKPDGSYCLRTAANRVLFDLK